MYVQSAASALTDQGKAIADASRRFGDGSTLPFTPCKRGYVPLVSDTSAAADDDINNGIRSKPKMTRRYACLLHDQARKSRIEREGGRFRAGEVDLNIFWVRALEGADDEESAEQKQQSSE